MACFASVAFLDASISVVCGAAICSTVRLHMCASFGQQPELSIQQEEAAGLCGMYAWLGTGYASTAAVYRGGESFLHLCLARTLFGKAVQDGGYYSALLFLVIHSRSQSAGAGILMPRPTAVCSLAVSVFPAPAGA